MNDHKTITAISLRQVAGLGVDSTGEERETKVGEKVR